MWSNRLGKILLFSFIITLSSVTHSLSSSPDHWLKNIEFSEKITSVKIVFVKFMPLPYKLPGGMMPHERVFTNELYSHKPTEAQPEGKFIPNNYLEIINENLEVVKTLYGLKLQVVNSVADIPLDADYIVFGTIQDFSCTERNTSISVNILLLKGKSFDQIKITKVQKSLEKGNIPLIVNHPLHTIGSHGSNFLPQRSLLSMISYMCIIDIIKFIDDEIKPL